MKIDEKNIGTEEFTVYTYNTDAHYIATIRWLFELCQEVAAQHSMLKDAGIPSLMKENRTWVITREQIHVSRYPVLSERVCVKTAIPESTGYFAPRSILATDSDGKELFRASAMWVIVDFSSRMPQKVGDVYRKIGCAADCDFMDYGLRHSPKLDPQIFRQGKPVASFSSSVGFPDCDINNHVNNIVYLDWALRAMPEQYMEQNRVRDIDIVWLHEVHINDEIEVQVYEIEKDSFGLIMNTKSNDHTVCLVRMMFADGQILKQ